MDAESQLQQDKKKPASEQEDIVVNYDELVKDRDKEERLRKEERKRKCKEHRKLQKNKKRKGPTSCNRNETEESILTWQLCSYVLE